MLSRLVGALLGALLAFPAVAQQDAGQDHPLLSRMPQYYVEAHEQNFDAWDFWIAEDKPESIEGQRTKIEYSIKPEHYEKQPSPLQVIRNHEAALKKIGGEMVYKGPTDRTGDGATFKVMSNGKEVWVSVDVADGTYTLVVVERTAMQQEITASHLLDEINAKGHVALYINFDTAKWAIKPEFQPVIDQIVALLQADPQLRLSIEGHTDAQGDSKANKELSQKRANSVMGAVIGGGIDPSRLKAVGMGQEKPVADNATEEGRAKNRRVELVKM